MQVMYITVQVLLALMGACALVSSIVLVVALISSFRRIQQDKRILPSLLPSDVSDKGLAHPERLQPLLTALQAMGFTRLGEAQLELPRVKDPLTTWLVINEEHDVCAEVVDGDGKRIEPNASFETMFENEAFVTTGYNIPHSRLFEPVNDPDYRDDIVSDSIEAAYRHHRSQVEVARANHGPVDIVGSMEDYLHHQQVYCRRFALRRMSSFHKGILRSQFTYLGLHMLVLILTPAMILWLRLPWNNAYLLLCPPLAGAVFILVTLLVIIWAKRSPRGWA